MAVYFAHKNGRIKIGTSVRPHYRARNLGAELMAVVPGSRAEEQAMHRRFGSYGLGQEWFSPAPELMTFIETLRPYLASRPHEGAHIQATREQVGLSQRELADRAGMTLGHLQSVEVGRWGPPSLYVVRVIARAMNMSISALYGEEAAS